MSFIRLYTAEDGRTHIEDLSLDSHPELAQAMRAESIIFRTTPPGHVLDWHPAPRRHRSRVSAHGPRLASH